MSEYYALVGLDNVVVQVDSATADWVAQWVIDNPGSAMRYLPTDIERKDYASIGFTWDETLERFIPPMPDSPGTWVYDEDEWCWVNLDPPPEESDVEA